MADRNHICIALTLAALCLVGCQTGPSARSNAAPTSEAIAQRNHGYALLYKLMSDEAKVKEILIIKSASAPTKQIIDDISSTAAAAKKRLEDFRDADASLVFNDNGLPSVEQKTRKAIADATAPALLLSSGATFERRLLLTQTDATQYAEYLSKTLAKVDRDTTRAAWLNNLSKQFGTLRQRVVDRLQLVPVEK